MNPITIDTVNDLRNEIAELIQEESVTSNVFAGDSVYAYPRSTFQSFPAAVVMPSENATEYGSSDNRKLLFSFHVNIYYPAAKESEQQKTEEAVGEAVAEILRIFCQKHPLTECDWVTPVPSVWGETTVGEATYRTATVILQCVKYINVQ